MGLLKRLDEWLVGDETRSLIILMAAFALALVVYALVLR